MPADPTAHTAQPADTTRMPAAATSRSSSQIQPRPKAPYPLGLPPNDLEPATSAGLRSPTFFHLRHNDVSIVSARISPTHAGSTPAGRCHLPLQPNCQRSSRSDRPQRPTDRRPLIGRSRTEHFSAAPDNQRPLSTTTSSFTRNRKSNEQARYCQRPLPPDFAFGLTWPPSCTFADSQKHPWRLLLRDRHFRASQMVKTPRVKNRDFTL